MRKTVLYFILSVFLSAAFFCVNARAEEAESCTHAYEEVVTPPSCTEQGYTTHLCTVCGDLFTDSYTEAAGHDFGEWKTAAGLTEKDREAISAKEDRTDEAALEMIEAGELEVRICANCGEVETRPAETASAEEAGEETPEQAEAETPAEAPEESESHTVTEEPGKETVTEEPGQSSDQEEPAAPEETPEQAADEETAGEIVTGELRTEPGEETAIEETGEETGTEAAAPVKAGTQLRGGNTEDTTTDSEEPEEHQHSFKDKIVAPTCTDEGYTKHTCSCGKVTIDTFTPATGHNWGEWTVVEYATYTKTGTEQRVCLNDSSHVETRTIAKLVRPTVTVGSARQDENGDYYDGKPGDQTTHEVETQEWYEHEKGWTVIRATSARAREMIAQCMEMICANDNVGYSMSDRFSLGEQAKKYDYDVGLVTKACNADCSTAVCVCVNYAGINVYDLVTDTEVSTLRATGQFKILTDVKYTKSPNYLLRGDILVTNTKGHTVVVLSDGKNSGVDWEPGIIITKQLKNTAVVLGSKATLTIGAEGEGLTYKWYKRTSSSGSWTEIEAARNKSSYTFTVLSSHKGNQICCIVRDSAGRRKASDTMTLSFRKALKILTQPVDVSLKEGETATFKISAQGVQNYQWYFKKPGSDIWKVMSSGGKSASYSLKTELRHDGYQYKCVVSYEDEVIESDVVTLSVAKVVPIIKTQPRSRAVALGSQVTFKVVAEDVQTYQWYYKKPNTDNWVMVTSAAGRKASYVLTTQERHHNYQYKCVLTYGKEAVETNVVRLTVVNTPPEITTQPASKTVSENKWVTFKVSAKGRSLHYRWYYRTGNGKEWKLVSAASGTTAKLGLTALAKRSGYQYKCVVTNLLGSVTSEIVKLTVK